MRNEGCISSVHIVSITNPKTETCLTPGNVWTSPALPLLRMEYKVWTSYHLFFLSIYAIVSPPSPIQREGLYITHIAENK